MRSVFTFVLHRRGIITGIQECHGQGKRVSEVREKNARPRCATVIDAIPDAGVARISNMILQREYSDTPRCSTPR